MSSLMKKLFDTLPLAGVEGALSASQGSFSAATVGQLKRHLEFHPQVARISVTCARSPQPSRT